MTHSNFTLIAIGGLDPTGGAGVIRDFLTAKEFGVCVTMVGTAWTIQTPTEAATVEPRHPKGCEDAIRSALRESAPMKTAVKVGMVANPKIAKAIVNSLTEFSGPVVLDPVLGATSGGALFQGPLSGLEPLYRRATLTTPNLAEAGALVGFPVKTIEDVEKAGRLLLEMGMQAVLVKGGHLSGEAKDVLFTAGGVRSFSAPRIPDRNPRGTGCALAAAIAVLLAEGSSLEQAIDQGKMWLWNRIHNARRQGGAWFI